MKYGLPRVLTAQTIFNKVATHLLTQKKRAVKRDKINGGSTCVMRTNDGRACAVGCLLSDAQAQGATGVANAIDAEPELNPFMYLLHDLMQVHDDAPPNQWAKELDRVAKRYSLRMPKVVQS
jgi:hypothetical protein